MSAAAVDIFDSPAIRRGKALLAEDRPITLAEQATARGDMEKAGRGSVEHGVLLAIYQQIDRRAADRMTAQNVSSNYRAANALAAERAARPARWSALTPMQRALHLVADTASNDVRTALLKLVRLVEADTAQAKPAETFEPEQY